MSLLYTCITYILKNQINHSKYVPFDLNELIKKCDPYINWHAALLCAVKSECIPLINYCSTLKRSTFLNALDWAAEYNKLRLIKYLEIKVNSIEPKCDFGFRGAARSGNLKLIKYFENKALPTYLSLRLWNTLLKISALYGHFNIVRYCETKGANNWKGAFYVSLARFDNLEIVKYCENKLIINNVNILWHNALEHAIKSSDLRIIKYCETKILHQGTYWDIIWTKLLKKAAYLGYFEIVKYLIKKSVNTKHHPIYWNAVLEKAAYSGNLEMIKYCEKVCQKRNPNEKINWIEILYQAYLVKNWHIVEYCKHRI